MVKVPAGDYEALKGFFVWMVDNVMPILAGGPTEHHPIAVLRRIEAESMANARKGLGMAIGDTIEMTENLTQQRVAEIDASLAAAGLPTLSAVRARFWSKIASIMKRGRVRSEGEYYALRNVVEALSASEAEKGWDLLADFELRVSGGTPRA